MKLDDEEVHLETRDVTVQRGATPNWIHRGTEPCVIAFVLIGAKTATRTANLFRKSAKYRLSNVRGLLCK